MSERCGKWAAASLEEKDDFPRQKKLNEKATKMKVEYIAIANDWRVFP